MYVYLKTKITKNPRHPQQTKTNINFPPPPTNPPPIWQISISHQETMEPLPSESKIRRIPSNSEVESETPNFRRAASKGIFAEGFLEGRGYLVSPHGHLPPPQTKKGAYA